MVVFIDVFMDVLMDVFIRVVFTLDVLIVPFPGNIGMHCPPHPPRVALKHVKPRGHLRPHDGLNPHPVVFDELFCDFPMYP